MALMKVYDQNMQEAGEVTLAPEVFEVEVRPEILNLVVRAYCNIHGLWQNKEKGV